MSAVRNRKPKHWMAYVRWDIYEKWRGKRPKESEHENAAVLKRVRKPAYPYAYGSKDCRLIRKVKKGDMLWLLTSPCYHKYYMPPSLIAGLKITQLIDTTKPPGSQEQVPKAVENFPYVVKAVKKKDSYFPINNAFWLLRHRIFFDSPQPDLSKYERRNKKKERKLGPYYTLGNYFRRFRKLTDTSGSRLRDYAEAILAGHRVFLSYRRNEVDWAEEFSDRLACLGISCWWDQWMIAKGRYKKGLLKNMIDDGVRQSAWFIPLVTPEYFDSDWTKDEVATAQAEESIITGAHRRETIIVHLATPKGGGARKRWKDLKKESHKIIRPRGKLDVARLADRISKIVLSE